MTKKKKGKVKKSALSNDPGVKMTSRLTASEAPLIPLFLGKQGSNITFIVNNSNNMRALLGSVKRLLIQTLLTKASLRNSLFNVLTFSSKVNLWSHHMLPCAPDTVWTALTWIHSVSCSPGRDLLAALSMALTDPSCQAVHLLCSGLPEQPEAVLRALPALAAGRPVNVFYLQDSGTQPDRNTRDYVQCLAEATSGSCYLIPFDPSGALNKAIPLHVAECPSSVPTVSPLKYCCPSTSVIAPDQHPTNPAFVGCSLGNSFCPGTSCRWSCETLGVAAFFPGCRVLARRQVDGLYHQGSVVQQLQGCSRVWVVEFDNPGSATCGVITSSQRQLICSLDIVNDRRGFSRHLAPGDAVLSPWEPDLKRYGPGRVVAVTERRDGVSAAEGATSLRVLMWNSCVSLVPGGLVLPISAAQYDRIARELQIPTSAPLPYCGWLCSRSSTCSPQLYCPSVTSSSCCSCSVTHHQIRVASPSCSSSLGRREDFDRAEHNTQLDLREEDMTKSDPEMKNSPSSSSLSEDETGASSSPEVKLRSNQRPPWRYWRRTGPEPQHRQPGSVVPRRTPQPARFMFPVPQTSASPNLSSLFHSLPGAQGRRANTRDVFGVNNFKPRPPAGLQPFSNNKAHIIYT